MLSQFVEGFIETPAGAIPRVACTLSPRDHLGTIGTRTGFTSNNYKIIPGLYCTGTPTKESPVLVTTNYKLSFDALRKELSGIDSWVLIIDTRGINVWCAGGKGTFSAEEIAYQVGKAELSKIVSHRNLILPLLSANGVTAVTLRKLCGFQGRFGPVLASMLPDFLANGSNSEEMSSVTFTLKERVALIPKEVCMLWKQLLSMVLLFFLLSGVSTEIFSFQAATSRSTTLLFATFSAIAAGSVATPIFLPWIPFRQFWLKGVTLGAISAVLFFSFTKTALALPETAALFLWITSCSSYLAMNFTGCTPYTSLSGVEKEMRRGLPIQVGSALTGAILWTLSPFM